MPSPTSYTHSYPGVNQDFEPTLARPAKTLTPDAMRKQFANLELMRTKHLATPALTIANGGDNATRESSDTSLNHRGHTPRLAAADPSSRRIEDTIGHRR
ncbi:MAG: hypothetical protein ACJAYU_000048 [Bradymonadia bacterium]|jgi:hypothetical protein